MHSTRRRFGRFQVAMPVEITLGGETLTAMSENLGLGGVLIETGATGMIGAPVSVRLDVPKPAHRVEIDGTVAWSRPGGLGIAFDALRPIDVWALLRFFNEGSGLVEDLPE